MSTGKCECGRVFCEYPDCKRFGNGTKDLVVNPGLTAIREAYSDYHEHREPCECPACQAGAYCIREIERVAGNCGE